MNEKYEIKNAMSAIIGNLPPQSLIVSCDKVTISVNALRLNVDFTTEQLKKLDTIEINGIVFQKTEQKL